MPRRSNLCKVTESRAGIRNSVPVILSKWIPEATRIRTEAGIHHSCDFSVYQVTYQGQTIEFKCKITDGELLYMMKFI